MSTSPSDRIRALPPYLFADIRRRLREALDDGRDVINFGVGDPDFPTHDFIVRRLAQEAANPANHTYSTDRGSPVFREAIAAFCQKRYGIDLDVEREIIALIGSKEGVAHLALAVVNPGDLVLVPNPAYPVYESGTIFAGGTVERFDLCESLGWLPDLDAIPDSVARKARLMWINYPNNPIGAVAPLSFYKRLIDWARTYDVLIAQDAAYNEMYFDEKPPSILEVPDARSCAVEFHSASKTFNMTGWRVGFAIGNRDVLASLSKIKANVDNGPFTAIQLAAVSAYENIDHANVRACYDAYQERTSVMAEGLRACGFDVSIPQATFYVWAGLPDGVSSMEASTRLLDEANVVAIPGGGFGSNGDRHLRFSMTVPMERIREALRRIGAMTW